LHPTGRQQCGWEQHFKAWRSVEVLNNSQENRKRVRSARLKSLKAPQWNSAKVSEFNLRKAEAFAFGTYPITDPAQ
jgi:hypothetical protein